MINIIVIAGALMLVVLLILPIIFAIIDYMINKPEEKFG